MTNKIFLFLNYKNHACFSIAIAMEELKMYQSHDHFAQSLNSYRILSITGFGIGNRGTIQIMAALLEIRFFNPLTQQLLVSK